MDKPLKPDQIICRAKDQITKKPCFRPAVEGGTLCKVHGGGATSSDDLFVKQLPAEEYHIYLQILEQYRSALPERTETDDLALERLAALDMRWRYALAAGQGPDIVAAYGREIRAEMRALSVQREQASGKTPAGDPGETSILGFFAEVRRRGLLPAEAAADPVPTIRSPKVIAAPKETGSPVPDGLDGMFDEDD